ncbi:MAG: peptide deformylase [Ruthenibacterium sp.]
MALRQIVQDGDPILKKVCRPVTNFDARLGELLDDMQETLLDANGLGLAGPQVGVMRRVFICADDCEVSEEEAQNGEYKPKFLEFINPEILTEEGEVRLYEGCLSFPGHNGAITRPQKVTARAFDRYGKPFTIEAEDMLARCICHENNHLDGITIMDLAEYFYEDQEQDDEDGEA